MPHYAWGRALSVTMDQTIEFMAADRRLATERLCAYLGASVDAAIASDVPFYHLALDRVFPDDVYATMLAHMPSATDYRPMHGRAKGLDLADGTHTRVKIDLFPEYIRHLPPEKRGVWNVIGRALCSRLVRDAFIRRLAPALKRRFGPGYAKVGMYPVPVLTRDIPGYRITRTPTPAGRASPCSSTCRATARLRTSGRFFTKRLPMARC